ncbi:MAG: CHAT domain-containing tetratricopeptide repeat protein [Acidobacteriota bacterium]
MTSPEGGPRRFASAALLVSGLLWAGLGCGGPPPTEAPVVPAPIPPAVEPPPLEALWQEALDVRRASGTNPTLCPEAKDSVEKAKQLRRDGDYLGTRRVYLEGALPTARAGGCVAVAANALAGLAVAYGYEGRLQEARLHQQAAEHLVRELDDRRRWAQIQIGFGAVLFRAGLHREALERLRNVESRFEAVEDWASLATTLSWMGRAETSLGELEDNARRFRDARKLHERAVDLRRDAGDSTKLATGLDALGVTLRLGGYHKQSEAAHREAVSLMVGAQDDQDLARVSLLANLAAVLLEQEKPGEALAVLEEARSFYPPRNALDLRSVNEIANLLFLESKAHLALGEAEDAVDRVDRLVARLEAFRTFGAPAPFFAVRETYFDFAIELLADHGRPEAALELVELLRARDLLDRLLVPIPELRAKLASTAPELVERDEGIRRRLLRSASSAGRDELRSLLGELLASEQAMRRRAGVVGSRPLRRPEIDPLLEPGTVATVFWLGERTSRLWVLEAGQPDVTFDLGVSGRKVLEWSRALRGDLSGAAVSNLATNEGPAAALSERLFALVARRLDAAERVLLLAGGDLAATPWVVLPHPERSEAWLDGPTFTVQPSFSALHALRQRRGERRRGQTAEAVVLVPEYDPEGDFDPLPGARREAEAIARTLPSATVHLAAEASRERVLSGALEGFRLVHFAAHGRLEHPLVDLSSVVLSDRAAGGGLVDPHLRLTDVAELRLVADLVTLSACETGLGSRGTESGPMAFPAAFLHAGAGGVVASLWRVDDAATAELMEVVYRGLSAGLDPATALRRGQETLRRSAHYTEPRYWGAWIFLGDWRAPENAV